MGVRVDTHLTADEWREQLGISDLVWKNNWFCEIFKGFNGRDVCSSTLSILASQVLQEDD